MDVKFTVVSQALLNSVEKSDGQIIVIYDEPGMYYDMNTKRYAVLGMQYQEVFQKPTLASIPDANDRTFYFYNSASEDGGLYLFNSTNREFVRASNPNSEINIYKVMIPSSGWVATSGKYTQDVSTSSSMSANSTIVTVLPASNSTAAQKAAFEQWESIETKAGGITITSATQISTNFGIVIIEIPEAN